MYVSGKNVAKEVLKNNIKVYKAFILDNFNDKNIISALQKRNIEIKKMTKIEMSKIDESNNQGIILDIPNFKYSDIDEILNGENSFIVILDHLEDPHNFGAIIRTCEAAGVSGIIIPKDRSVEVNSTVMKTSAGALINVKICSVTNLKNAIEYLKKKGIWIVGTDMENSTDYNIQDYDMPLALVIGSEGFGMSRLVKESCDFIISIPMKGKINSLNASVAAGIVIYKVMEKRK